MLCTMLSAAWPCDLELDPEGGKGIGPGATRACDEGGGLAVDGLRRAPREPGW